MSALLLALTLALVPYAASAAADPSPAPSAARSSAGGIAAAAGAVDTATPFPAKLPAREPWERWVNLPLTVAWFLPNLALRGAGAAIGYIDETKLIPKIHRVLVSEDGTRAILPVFTVQTGAGITVRKRGLLGEESRLSVVGSTGEDWRHQIEIALRRMELPFGLETDLDLDYRYLTEEIYFGIGPRTRESAAADYSLLQVSGLWTLAARTDHAGLAFRTGLRRAQVIAGRDEDYPSITERYEETTAPGLSDPALLAQAGVDLRLDTYDGPDPRRGGEIQLSATLDNEAGDLPYAFAGFGVHAQHLVPVAYGRVLALRISAEKTLPLPGRSIPFHALPEIGRDGTVRGYTRGRFRDRDALYGSAEYRWPVWTPHFRRALEFLLFADAGQVARSLPDDLDAGLFRPGYGAGVRYYGKGGLITRLEVGMSGERVRAYFSLN